MKISVIDRDFNSWDSLQLKTVGQKAGHEVDVFDMTIENELDSLVSIGDVIIWRSATIIHLLRFKKKEELFRQLSDKILLNAAWAGKPGLSHKIDQQQIFANGESYSCIPTWP